MKKECLLQRIKQMDRGNLEYIYPVLSFLLLVPLLIALLQILQHMNSSAEVEDALAYSNLASAVIDIKEFGTTNNIVIKDVNAALTMYKAALKTNLQLDDNWECRRESIISGRVKIENYSVYNVTGQDITIYEFNENGVLSTNFYEKSLGSIYAPDNTLITTTSIYSRITFPVKSLFNIELQGQKEKCIDITVN